MSTTTTSSLPDVMKALGATTADLKGLSPKDRDDLKRYLDEQNVAVAHEQAVQAQ